MKNCLTYALGKLISTWHAGGALIMRKAHFVDEFPGAGKWHPAHLVPHFLYRSPDHEVTQYVPTDADRAESARMSGFRRWLKLWHFHGQISGDDKVGPNGN